MPTSFLEWATSMPPEEDNDPFSNMDRMGGDEAVPDEVDDNTKDTNKRQRSNVPSEEQIKAEEAANAEIAKIKLQNESNDAEIDNLKRN